LPDAADADGVADTVDDGVADTVDDGDAAMANAG
jgi:hypothetical protein